MLYCTPVSQVTEWCNGVITPDSQSHDTEFRSWWNLFFLSFFLFLFFFSFFLLLQHQQHQKCAAFFFFFLHTCLCVNTNIIKNSLVLQFLCKFVDLRQTVDLSVYFIDTFYCWLLCVLCLFICFVVFCLFVVINFFFYLFFPLHFYKYMCTFLQMRASDLCSEVRAMVYVLQVPNSCHVPHHGGAEGWEPPAAKGGQGRNADAA